MRMMGAESVEYHRATVLGRADDHPGMAMEYYASRGETPLVWGGSGRAGLGLEGASHQRTTRRYSALAVPATQGPVSGWCSPVAPGWRLWSRPRYSELGITAVMPSM